MGANPQFIVSVANLYAYDPVTNDLLFKTRTNVNTSFNISMSNTESRGSEGHVLLFQYYHSRTVEMTIESNTWEKDWLASQVGATIATQSENVITTRCVTLSSDSGTLDPAPATGTRIAVQRANGTRVMITPTGGSFTVPGAGNEKVTVDYFSANASTERINVNAGVAPRILRLVLEVPQFSQSGIDGRISIEIPRFQCNGTFDINLTSDGIQSSMLSGMALAFDVDNGDNTCDTQAYAIIRIAPTDTTVTYASIVGLVGGSNNVDVPATGGTYQVDTIGIRGGLYANVPITDDLTYSMKAGSDSDITIDSNGLITIAGTATAGDSGIAIVTYTGQTPNLTAEVNVDVV